VFADAVTEEEAPGYYDVVKNPMDFAKMKDKLAKGVYGNGSEAASALYEDFVLVFDNCILFNSEDSEVTREASRILGHLPESFASACLTIARRIK
jgi:Bromodomain